MPDWSKCKVYKLVADGSETFYVGSTCQQLYMRMGEHRKGARNMKRQSNIYKWMRDVGIENVRMEVVSEHPECTSFDEQRMFERRAVEQLKPSLNMRAPYLSIEERRDGDLERTRKYHKENRDKMRDQRRKYREANCERLAEKCREWHKANRERQYEKHREYCRANRERLKVYHRERARTYRAANRDEINAKHREYQRQRRAANRDEINAKAREYRAANHDKINERRRQVTAAHRDEINAKAREYQRQRRVAKKSANIPEEVQRSLEMTLEEY